MSTDVVGNTVTRTTWSAVGISGEPKYDIGTEKKPSTVALPRTLMYGRCQEIECTPYGGGWGQARTTRAYSTVSPDQKHTIITTIRHSGDAFIDSTSYVKCPLQRHLANRNHKSLLHGYGVRTGLNQKGTWLIMRRSKPHVSGQQQG